MAKGRFWVWSVSDISPRNGVWAALPCRPSWSTFPKTVEIICPKWNAYKLIYRSLTTLYMGRSENQTPVSDRVKGACSDDSATEASRIFMWMTYICWASYDFTLHSTTLIKIQIQSNYSLGHLWPGEYRFRHAFLENSGFPIVVDSHKIEYYYYTYQ
jgi:hypothetical protein